MSSSDITKSLTVQKNSEDVKVVNCRKFIKQEYVDL